MSDILTQCQNELRNWQTHENESGKMVSENEHNLMYIYHKKCEIMEREKIGETASVDDLESHQPKNQQNAARVYKFQVS